MGIASEILPVFCRKPIFGYHAMAFSMIAIAFLSWVVYGHHMFVSGMNPALGMAFTVTTMIIAVPSAIKTFNWLGTLWGARIQFTVPMLNALAFVSMFVIGGLSGILDRKSTRLNSSHGYISYAVFCLKKKKHRRRTAVPGP